MTNEQIRNALYAMLNNAALGYPIAWPGFNFTPPSTGVWLQVDFFPNEGIDEGMADNSTVIPQGIFQIMVCSRPGEGVASINQAIGEVSAVFGKGSTIVGMVRVRRSPYESDRITQDDRMMIPLTIQYTG